MNKLGGTEDWERAAGRDVWLACKSKSRKNCKDPFHRDLGDFYPCRKQ